MRKTNNASPPWPGIQVVVSPYLPAGQMYMVAGQGQYGAPMLVSGTMASVRFDPSPADLYPQAAEWALALLNLSYRGEVSLEPTQTAISLGALAKVGGWMNGSVVCLMEEHIYNARHPETEWNAYDSYLPERLPRLSLGIVVDGADLASPLVGFTTRLKLFGVGCHDADHGWSQEFSTRIRVPFHRLAILREPDGEAMGVDYLSGEDSQKVVRSLVFKWIVPMQMYFAGIRQAMPDVSQTLFWWERLGEAGRDSVLAAIEKDPQGGRTVVGQLRSALESR